MRSGYVAALQNKCILATPLSPIGTLRKRLILASMTRALAMPKNAWSRSPPQQMRILQRLCPTWLRPPLLRRPLPLKHPLHLWPLLKDGAAWLMHEVPQSTGATSSSNAPTSWSGTKLNPLRALGTRLLGRRLGKPSIGSPPGATHALSGHPCSNWPLHNTKRSCNCIVHANHGSHQCRIHGHNRTLLPIMQAFLSHLIPAWPLNLHAWPQEAASSSGMPLPSALPPLPPRITMDI